jgi:MFS family permease
MPTGAEGQMPNIATERSRIRESGLWTYENKLLSILSATEASMFVDRLALGLLTPFIVSELKLTNFEVGLLASVFSVSFAVAGYVGGWIADRTGKRGSLLMLHVLAFSVLSAITGFAWSFAFLLTVRLILGLAEGPVLPLLQSIMIPVSSPTRRAFNAAFLQNVAPFVIGQFAAPIVLTHLAVAFDWRLTFFMTAIPGLLILPFLYVLLRRDSAVPDNSGKAAAAVRAEDGAGEGIYRNRNLLLCVAMAACTGTWIYMFNTFLPLYLVRVAGYSTITMGYATSMLGIGGCVASLFLPALSDRLGRKPILMAAFLLGLVAPLAVLFTSQSTLLLIAGLLVGSCVLGITPLTITIIPADSVAPSSLASAIGITSASSAIIGGMVMTAIAGKAADFFGLQAPFVIAFAALGAALVISSFLRPGRGPRPLFPHG